MKTSRAWSARLAIAGACLVWAGCGGSDVPDPDSDSHAATSDTPKAIARADAPQADEPATEPAPSAAVPGRPARPRNPPRPRRRRPGRGVGRQAVRRRPRGRVRRPGPLDGRQARRTRQGDRQGRLLGDR